MRWFYTLTLFFGGFLTLWDFLTVCSLAMTSTIGIPYIYTTNADCVMDESFDAQPQHCAEMYRIYVVIFSTIFAGLVLLDFSEQVWLQVSLFLARLAVFCGMICFSIYWLVYGVPSEVTSQGSSDSNSDSGVSLWRMGGSLTVLSILAFANFNQFAQKSMIEPLNVSNKQKFPQIVQYSMLFAGIMCVSISVSLFNTCIV